MKLFSRNEINTGRQFEFDLAKAICILGMVFVHCFEEFPLISSATSGLGYFIIVVVLDAIFGAGTFMACMGVGIAYSQRNEPKYLIKRGVTIFLLAYLLNIVRYTIPSAIYLFGGDVIEALEYMLGITFCLDILQFAGLALILFGLLKKFKVPDWGIGLIALAMSIAGSFLRFIYSDNFFVTCFGGTILGLCYTGNEEAYAYFPLLNWFITVAFGYLFGKLLRRCENKDRLYLITTPLTGLIIAVYLAIAIPKGIGMMSGDFIYYYQMTTPEMFVVLCGAVFACGLYHFISKLFNDKMKNLVTGLSRNINKTYFIHWIIIGWVSTILYIDESIKIHPGIVAVFALIIYVISSFLAEVYRKHKENKKALNNEREPANCEENK